MFLDTVVPFTSITLTMFNLTPALPYIFKFPMQLVLISTQRFLMMLFNVRVVVFFN